MNLLRGAALVLAATVMVGGLGQEEEEGRIGNEALEDSSLEASEGESTSEGGDWEQENFGSRTTGERSDGLLDRLKVDENAPSLPSRSLKRDPRPGKRNLPSLKGKVGLDGEGRSQADKRRQWARAEGSNGAGGTLASQGDRQEPCKERGLLNGCIL